ncbi:MAG: hypothetical protein AAB839_00555 [Patescibacteria group bacterium]
MDRIAAAQQFGEQQKEKQKMAEVGEQLKSVAIGELLARVAEKAAAKNPKSEFALKIQRALNDTTENVADDIPIRFVDDGSKIQIEYLIPRVGDWATNSQTIFTASEIEKELGPNWREDCNAKLPQRL